MNYVGFFVYRRYFLLWSPVTEYSEKIWDGPYYELSADCVSVGFLLIAHTWQFVDIVALGFAQIEVSTEEGGVDGS